MLKRYLSDTSGNFAIMFSIFGTALLICVAGSVDLMGIQKQKSELQSMTDAAVLAAAATKSDNQAELLKIAQASIDANNFSGTDINVNLSIDNDIISVNANSQYETQLMGVLGMKDIPLKAISEAPIPRDTPLNIALVLDRTGSMAGTNLSSLKTASAKLIDIFDSYDGEVRAGVVPFSDYVNVGLSNRSAKWMDVPDDSSTIGTEEICVTKRDLINEGLCTTETTVSTKDGREFEVEYQSCPDSVYGPEYEECSLPTTSITWHGCVGSREGTLNKEPDFRNKQFEGLMNIQCGEEILPLTMNITDVKTKIDSLSASGMTYIPAGLIWGWRLLDASEPFDDLTNQEKRRRALILMTDGANTRSIEQPYHTGNDTDIANGLTAELCDSMKKEGIELFTVAYRLSDSSDTKDVIRVCASSEQFFFDAASTAELEAAFEEIGRSLYEVRLSR